MSVVRRVLLFLTLAVACLFLFAAPPASAQNPNISFDEQGNGSLKFPASNATPTTGVLAPDPGPGGLASALTYNLLGPPSLVAGDLFLTANGQIGDVIRFNPAGTGGNASYPASVVFYSTPGGGELADTGFSSLFYANTFALPELAGVTSYTPTSTQPGFISGFATTYLISSPAPEPSPLAALAVGMVGVTALAVRRRRASYPALRRP